MTVFSVYFIFVPVPKIFLKKKQNNFPQNDITQVLSFLGHTWTKNEYLFTELIFDTDRIENKGI